MWTGKGKLFVVNITSKSNESKEMQKKMCVRTMYQERKMKGEFHLLIKEMKLLDHALLFAYFHMNPIQYERMLTIVAPRIQEY